MFRDTDKRDRRSINKDLDGNSVYDDNVAVKQKNKVCLKYSGRLIFEESVGKFSFTVKYFRNIMFF